MVSVERLYLKVMLPVTLLILAAIFAFNLDLEKRIQILASDRCKSASAEGTGHRLEPDETVAEDLECSEKSTRDPVDKSGEVEEGSSAEQLPSSSGEYIEGSTDDYEEEEEISSKVDSFESSSGDNSVVGSSSSVFDLTVKEPDYMATMTKS